MAARMASIQEKGDSVAFAARYLLEDGVDLPVADIGNSQATAIDSISVDGTDGFNGIIYTTQTMAILRVAKVIIIWGVSGTMPGKIDDDIIADFDLRVINETEKRVDDIGTGWERWLFD